MASCFAGAWLWFEFRQTIEARADARSALIQWQQIYSEVKDAESGTRGFVITGDPSYLAHFEQATVRLPGLMLAATAAEGLLKDGLPTARIEDLQKRIQALLNATQATITVAQREGSARAADLLKQGEANARMDAVRAGLDERLAELDHRLRDLDSAFKSNLTVGGRALLVLIAATFAASAASAAALRHAILQAKRSEELALQKLRAEQENREKSVFLATMSHEIRTPMNAILGFGDLLLTDARDEKQTRYASSIVRSGQALLQLINDILDFSKIEAGMIEIAAAPMDVRELAGFTLELFAHQCAEKGVALKVEVENDVPNSLLLDGPRLRQIVINLVGNAVKFTQAGTVWLKFRSQPSEEPGNTIHLSIDVSDTGPGIAANRIEYIFEPFVQANGNREAEQTGTGLGLAIVKRLSTLMRGSVSVQSEEGRGSTFTVDLPDVEISARLAHNIATPSESAVDFNDLERCVILAVDDNADNLSVVKGYFDGSHHSIATAPNGKEALKWLGGHPRPDLVLMDIRMPVMDGRTALAEIRKNPELSLLPVIAVTASSLSQDEQELRAAFDGYVRKPFSRAQLFAEVAEFIPRRAPSESPEPVDEGPAPAAWMPLAERLRDLEKIEWPAVRDGMVMSEVAGFASELQRLALEAQCPPLEDLARRIIGDADSFSLAALEKSLSEFPAIVAHIERRAGASAS